MRPSVLPLLLASVLSPNAGAQETDPPGEEILGGAAAFSRVDEERERVWVEPGTVIFTDPDASSAKLETVLMLSEIEVLERQGAWCRVHFAGRSGWINPELDPIAQGVRVVRRSDMLPVETPPIALLDAERRRALALAALGLDGPNGRLGPWQLMTDVSDERLIERLDRVARHLTETYAARFGLEPAPPDDQAVALFSTEATYRPFESEATHLAGFGARGHAGGRMAALFIEGERPENAAFLLVHELTHLMNRAALGPTPPPWIEEGIANDLAYCRLDRAGALRLGTINGERLTIGNRRSGVTVQYSGAIAALADLVRKRSRRAGTPLEELVGLDQAAFLADPKRAQHYVESAFLVRFLLDGEKRRHAAGFRSYLASLARTPTGAADLGAHLETDWRRLERAFDAWLRVQAVQLTR